jgi:Zn-finger nucleic acid-binding protein
MLSEAYRDQGARCPACNDMMEQRILEGCTIDVCARCRGVWIDWFDGELLEVTRQVGPLSHREPVAIPQGAPCPRCQRPLAWGKPHTLLRCGECGGTFVPRPAFDELLTFALEDAPQAEDESTLQKLVRVMKALVGGERTSPP